MSLTSPGQCLTLAIRGPWAGSKAAVDCRLLPVQVMQVDLDWFCGRWGREEAYERIRLENRAEQLLPGTQIWGIRCSLSMFAVSKSEDGGRQNVELYLSRYAVLLAGRRA